MRHAYIAAILICLGPGLAAAPTAEILERSAKFANDALGEIEQGNRRGAIIAALKGLPVNPDSATLALYSDAYEMLFRAMASRTVNVDRESWQAYAVNTDGARAVVMGINSTIVSNGSGDPTIEFDAETRTMVSRGGPVYLPIEDEPPHILVDPRTGDTIADLMPFGAIFDHNAGYSPARPPAFSPDGGTLAAWHMADGLVLRFDATEGTPLSTLNDLAGRRPGTVVGYSPDGTMIAATADGLAAVWDATTGTLFETLDMPRHTIATDWTYDNHLLSLQLAGYEPDSEISVSIYRDGKWDAVMSLTGRATQLPTQYMQVSKTGPHILLDQETRVDLVNYETDEVINLGPVGTTFHRFIRDGSAIAWLTDGGLFGFLSGRMTLMVVALDGTELAAVPRDWVTFDQYASIQGRNPKSFGFVRPYTYHGDDLPDGPPLWQAAMAILNDAERAEIAAERIVLP